MTKGVSSLRRQMKNAAAGLALGFAAAMVLFPSTANAWWNDEWQLRKKINIDASATGANITDPIGSVPVLVRLHSGNFRFSLAKDDGSDLRFVATDDKTPLKHHIEKWDSAARRSAGLGVGAECGAGGQVGLLDLLRQQESGRDQRRQGHLRCRHRAGLSFQ
ncbi:hypothetical protein ACVOMS_34880 [Bradyrhizobium guangxiense]